MAKSSGLGGTLLVGGYELGNDVGAVTRIASPIGVQDVTGLDSSARETILTLRDGMIDFTPHFNPAAGQAHERLSALPTADVLTSYVHRRTTQGSPAACLLGKQITYDANRAQSGELTWAVPNVGNNYGMEWCTVITDDGVTTSTGAENLGGYDFGASSAFGLQAYLHVTAFTGTSATITIQESSDDGAGDAYAAVTGGAFTAVTGVGTERIATSNSQTVEQWLRVAITGTYTNLQLTVMVNRNSVAGVVF